MGGGGGGGGAAGAVPISSLSISVVDSIPLSCVNGEKKKFRFILILAYYRLVFLHGGGAWPSPPPFKYQGQT